MSLTGFEDHKIELEKARSMIRQYQETSALGTIKGGFFGKSALLTILSQKDCIGIRYYFGRDEAENISLVLVGVDANENDMSDGEIAERQWDCPPHCSMNNALTE